MATIPEWLIGTAAPGSEEDAPEWLIHTRAPRFICRVLDEAEEAPVLSAFSYADGDWVLCDFEFIDDPPAGDALRELCRLAMDALA